jgi:LysM repeat protein
MAGLAAAAVAFSNTPAASAATADTSGHHETTAAAAPQAVVSLTQLISLTAQSGPGAPVIALDATRLAAMKPKGKHHRTLPAKYVVKPGDTLASIAQHLYHGSAYWTALYWANQHKIGDANDIQAGQVLTVPAKPAKIPGAPATLAPAPAATTSTASYGESYSAGAATTPPATQSTGSDSSFQACVIAAESGGNAQVMSAGGYYGLYQFSAATWAAYGGNPADWGHASVAEQNQVFENAIAAGGASNWAPYDGC